MSLFLALALLAVPAQDTVRVSAMLDKPRVAVGESVILEVSVETTGARARIQPGVDLPAGLEVLGTSHHDQRQFSLPGGRRRIMGQRLVILARAPGRYRIPEFAVEVDGSTYRTRSQVLTVSPRATTSGGTSRTVVTPRARDDAAVKLDAWLNTDTAYVGEQVTLTAEAKFSREARMTLRRSPEYEPPSPSGFWVQDLPDAPRTGSRVEGDRVYEVQAFRRAYFPLSAGQYRLPPARLLYEVRRGMLYAPQTRELRSDSLRLVVLPVPEADRPADYTGAVGSFVADAYVEPREVPAGEAAVLTLEVTGQGNVKALPPPTLPALTNVQVFPPSEEADTRITDGIVSGTKRFSWVLIPREPGVVDLPSIDFPYFDPERDAFAVAETAPVELRVREGAAITALEAAPAEQLRFVKIVPDPSALAWVRSPFFALAQVLPLLALGFVLVRRRTPSDRVTRRGLRKRRDAALAALRARTGDEEDRAFFTELATAARHWLADRTGDGAVRTASGTRLRRILERRGTDPDTARELVDLLARLATARYAPAAPSREERRSMLDEMGRHLERIDDEAMAPEPRAASLSVLVPLLLTVGALSVPAPTAAQAPTEAVAEDAFRRGVAALQANDLERAVRAFEDYTRFEPGDGNGWYNLGNAYYRAERRGLAVWAWLKALRLKPRDGDVRHNLTVAGSSPALVSRARPTLPLSPDETLLAASAAWLLAVGAFGIFLVKRRRGAAVGGGVAVLVTLVLLVSWARTGRARDMGVVVGDRGGLHAAPDMRADLLRPVVPGEGVVVLATRDQWLRVETIGGEQGWMEAGNVRPL